MPALNVLSTTLPDSTFFSLVRTNAAALAGLDVLELDDGPELAVEVEHHAVLEVVRGRHGLGLLDLVVESAGAERYGARRARFPTAPPDSALSLPPGAVRRVHPVAPARADASAPAPQPVSISSRHIAASHAAPHRAATNGGRRTVAQSGCGTGS